MSRFELEELSRFGDFTDNQELSDLLNSSKDELFNSLSDVRVSPDGRHIHIIPRNPQLGLMTYDKYERPQPTQNHKKLELFSPRTVPVVDVCYMDHNNNNSSRAVVAAVIYENGRAEFWCFQESKAGWRLLQTSDLCNSPKARVVSVCVCSSFIIWCEERPPSESSTRNKLRYCVCRRDFEVEDGAVLLAGVNIILHNNPEFTVVSSGENVHLLPDLKAKPLSCISKKFFLTWCPRRDSFAVGAVGKNTPVKRLSSKECDFKKLITDCLGYLSALEPPEIVAFSPTGCGGLLLLLGDGWLWLLQKDGTTRQVHKLPESCLVKHGTRANICAYINVVALIMGRNLHLIELSCGRELQTIVLKGAGVLYANRTERRTPHLLSETGLFAVVDRKTDSADCSFQLKPPGLGTIESVRPGALLIEAVFEEACKYYQQRSLSSTQLTVDALKKGGRFQAPTSLASILGSFLSTGLTKKGAELLQNGEGEFGQDKLMASLEGELKALVALEELKGSLVRGGAEEAEAVCETLVEKEVVRLLSSSEMDKEELLYLNSIFSVFPCQAWRAVQAALQLHHTGEGLLSSRAPSDVWKAVLSHQLCSRLLLNGQPKLNRSRKGDHSSKGNPPASPGVLPVFELLCQSVLRFQPTWLPRFLELAQQQQGAASLGLSLASSASSWSFSSGRGGGGEGENSVPLYKRALCVLSGAHRDGDQRRDLEVELLLAGRRPNAILQALRILMSERRWERVTQVARQFCTQSPLLNKEIFTTLLCEVAQHRDLDPYLDLLWTLCPEDFTVTTILNLVLKSLPSPNTSPHPASFSVSHTNSSPPPFADPHSSSQLTIGLLKPLLRKVLQSETKPSQRYVDILQSPSYPPPALPRRPTEQASSVTCPSRDSALGAETPEPRPSARATIQRSSIALSAAPLGFD